MSEPLKVQIVAPPGGEVAAARRRLAGAVLSLALFGAMMGIQWWMTTADAERKIALKKVGVYRCSLGRWHFERGGVQFPPRCLCRWEDAPRARVREADAAEREARGQTQ